MKNSLSILAMLITTVACSVPDTATVQQRQVDPGFLDWSVFTWTFNNGDLYATALAIADEPVNGHAAMTECWVLGDGSGSGGPVALTTTSGYSNELPDYWSPDVCDTTMPVSPDWASIDGTPPASFGAPGVGFEFSSDAITFWRADRGVGPVFHLGESDYNWTEHEEGSWRIYRHAM